MKITMQSTRWVAPLGFRLCLFHKGETYDVSPYCGHYLISHGYAKALTPLSKS